jgi:hypothetical protein
MLDGFIDDMVTRLIGARLPHDLSRGSTCSRIRILTDDTRFGVEVVS